MSLALNHKIHDLFKLVSHPLGTLEVVHSSGVLPPGIFKGVQSVTLPLSLTCLVSMHRQF